METHSQSDSASLSTPTQISNKTNWLGVGLALVFATAAFFSGWHMGSGNNQTLSLQAGLFSLFASTPAPAEEVDLSEFWRVWHLLEDKYVQTGTSTGLSTEERLSGAIDGLVDSYGDPYTIFLPPAEAESFEQDISGNFGGVGMEVGMRDGVVTVIAPLPESPAQAAGIRAGDIVVRIDGESSEDMNVDQAVRLIRGEVGTDVALTLFREGEMELVEVTVTRDTINIPTVKTETIGDVFVIRLYNFNAISELKMQEALREFVRSDSQKLVLDLRGNPGGFLQSAISIASYFLPAGKVVVRENFGNAADEQVFRSQGKMLRGFAPDEMVVLVDGGSASASEILAGALSQQNVATLIGQPTFGKGSVQELVDLPSGASLKVTVARWLTPDGTSISEGGLAPDIEVERTNEQFLNDEDPQLDAALEYLNRN